MRRFFSLCVFLVCGIVAYGQDILDFRMCDVFNGKVKSIIQTSPEMIQNEVEFMIDGRVRHYKNKMFEVNYEWISDEELKLEVTTSQGSQIVYMYINEYRKEYYDIDFAESNCKIWFRDNGGIDRKEMRQNGVKATQTYYYHSDSDLYPYKIESIMGTQSQVIYINVEKYDSKGNAIIYSQTSNGVTFQCKRIKTYYNE